MSSRRSVGLLAPARRAGRPAASPRRRGSCARGRPPRRAPPAARSRVRTTTSRGSRKRWSCSRVAASLVLLARRRRRLARGRRLGSRGPAGRLAGWHARDSPPRDPAGGVYPAPKPSKRGTRAAPSGRGGGSPPGPRSAGGRRRAPSSVISSPGWAGRQCSANASRRGAVEQRVVEPVGRERLAARRGLVVAVAHRHPDVGVDGVGAGDGLGGVVGQLRAERRPRAGSRPGAATATSTPASAPTIASERATLLPSPT